MCKTATNAKIHNEIPATVPSGFPQYRSQMIVFFLFLTALYFTVIAFFDPINAILQLPPSPPRLCTPKWSTNPEEEPCWRSDLFAFEVVSGVGLGWAAILGFQIWHLEKIDQQVPATPEGRLFGYIPKAHLLIAAQTTFQFYDLFISLLIPEQCQPIMLCHHIMAATVSWYGLNNQYFHYYGVFFLGCSELSTIPLVFMDIGTFFPPIPGTKFQFLIEGICQPIFVVAFVYYRFFAWWKTSRMMFQDISYALQSGISDKLRPGRNHVLYVMMTLNLLLGCLQLYWLRILIAGVLQAVGILPPETDINYL